VNGSLLGLLLEQVAQTTSSKKPSDDSLNCEERKSPGGLDTQVAESIGNPPTDFLPTLQKQSAREKRSAAPLSKSRARF
jgi:hypothetical protein